jgi:hypothetical protein
MPISVIRVLLLEHSMEVRAFRLSAPNSAVEHIKAKLGTIPAQWTEQDTACTLQTAGGSGRKVSLHTLLDLIESSGWNLQLMSIHDELPGHRYTFVFRRVVVEDLDLLGVGIP